MNPTDRTRAKDAAEAESVERLTEVVRERNLYARTLAEANRLYEEKVKELNALRRVGDALRSVLSVRKVCCEIVDILVEEVGAENCSLMLLDREGGRLSIKAARGQRDARTRYFDRPSEQVRFKLGEGVAGWVAERAEPVLIPDTGRDKRFKPFETAGMAVRSLLCLPLVEGNQVWGVLNLSHSDINAFTEDNERILTIIANQAAIALANVGLFQRLQEINEALEETVAVRTTEVRRQAGQLAVINRIAKTVNSVIDPEAVLGVIVDQVRQLVVFDRASIATFDEHEGVLRFSRLDLESGRPAQPRTTALEDGIVSESLRTGRVTPFDAKECGALRGFINGADLATGVVVPLIFQEKARGILVLGSSDPNSFRSADQDLLGELSEHLAVAVEKSRLYHEVRKMNEELELMVEERTRELRESEGRYRALFEKSAEAVFLISPDGRLINANDRFYQLTGCTGDDAASCRLEASDGRRRPMHEWTAPAVRGETIIPELTIDRRDGDRRIIDLRLNPIELGGETVILGVAHDITRRKGLEEQLLRSEQLAAMGTLAASVAHEINNPLQGIKNCLNLLRKSIGEGRREQEIFDLVQQGFTRIRDIVRQVLDFHRPSAQATAPLDLNQTISALLTLFEGEFERHGLTLTFKADPTLPRVVGSQSRLEQVGTNIILNARDAMSKGGSLTITTSHTDDDVVVEFVDTGHGISPEDLKNVFQPFFTRKRSGKGTGLGLWVSHSVIEEHGGRLEIDSSAEQGTTVRVVLPQAGKDGARADR